jgi:uncharacterized protein
MKAAALILIPVAVLPYALADDTKPPAGRLPAGCEVVMSPGMKITATTPAGAIAITAVDELTRSYTWEGATRAIEMCPRTDRWYGSLGIFNPGAGEHWRDHHGITRCVTEEGQQHFKTVEDALKWIKRREWMSFVYGADGLMVGWNKNLPRKQLDVEVWQILIDGKKPKELPGSQDDRIVVETVETETVPLVKAVASNDLKAVKALLATGADPNVRNSVEIPVLVLAIRSGSAPMVEVLLKSKANPNIRDVDTDLPALMEALERPENIKLLLAAGADVNAASRKEGDLMGMTPLMLAALDGSEDLVQLFLDNGADVSAKDAEGRTALSLAKQYESFGGSDGHKGVIRRLETASAKK